MKIIKTFESFNSEEEDDNKIRIYTGSHYSNKERNEEAFAKLNALLLSEENPYYDIFNEEDLYLDDTNGFIAIIESSSATDDITEDTAKGINDFIRQHLYDEDIFIYISNYIYRK